MKKVIKLYNGQKVKLGDTISFLNSDGNLQTDVLRMRKDKSLYFWNTKFHPTYYRTAYKP